MKVMESKVVIVAKQVNDGGEVVDQARAESDTVKVRRRVL